jgi:D-glycero-D-manno-heptose 1,7-bisphosphate phosphatase
LSAKARAVFLDRDGVLTEAAVRDGRPQSPRFADEMVVLDEAVGACRELERAGLLRICVTNQPEIARGGLEQAELDAMNERLRRELSLDAIVVCPHDDADGCDCRKPKPGMLLAAADRFGIDLSASFTVGDRWRDVDAGRSAGTRTVFIDRDYDEALSKRPDVVVRGIEEATRWIIRQIDQ